MGHLRDRMEQDLKLKGVSPPEKQIEAVERRLRELNPEFRGKIQSSIRDGKVVSLDFLTDQVTDISPVRALKGLESLECGGSAPRKGRLSDLTPVRGLRLRWLACEESRVTDLEPLRGMPVESLHVHNTGVVQLPDMDLGDYVYSENIGAYSAASSTFFNGFPPAKVVHINQGMFSAMAR
jgi:hypothetical protein